VAAPQYHIAFGVLLVSGASLAQEASRVPELPLIITGCPREYEVQLPAAVRIEANALNQERSREARPPALRQIAVTCSEPTIVHVDVLLMQGQVASRDLDQSTLAPEARVRALALSTMELVDELWTSIRAPQATAARSSIANRVVRPVVVERLPRPTPVARAVLVAPVVERVGRPGAWLFGGEIELAWRIGSVATASGQLRGLTGNAGSDGTPVRVTSGSSAGYVLFGNATGRLRWGIGPGLRAGVAVLSGDAKNDPALQGYTLTAPWGGIGGRAEVSRDFSVVPLRVALSSEAGVVTLRAVGTMDNTRQIYALDGVWFAIVLATGLTF
jgi:hypothetical protein